MSDITKVALDAMGGDNAPGEIVKGAVEAVGRRKDIKIFLTGKEDFTVYLSEGADRDRECDGSDRDC